MNRLVISHFQTMRWNHAVEGQLLGQAMIEVAVLFLLRIHLLGQGQFLFLVGRNSAYLLSLYRLLRFFLPVFCADAVQATPSIRANMIVVFFI